MAAVWLRAAACAAGLGVCSAAWAQAGDRMWPALAAPPDRSLPAPAPERARAPALEPRTLLQLALLQNSDLLFAKLQSRIADQGAAAERALYEPIAYATLRREGRDRQRTVEERLTAALGGLTRLDETSKSVESGLRMRVPSGGEATLALRTTSRRSNVIGSATFALADSEAVGALVLSLRQPLLRGYGRDILETDRRVADAEAAIGRWQFRQQALRVASDALSAYWQLQRASESQQWRIEARDFARELREDARARVAGGRLPPAALDEAEANLAAREAEIARGRLTLAEAEGRIRVLLDLPPDDGGWRTRPPGPEPAGTPAATSTVPERLPTALAAWPALRIAQLKREQTLSRLAFAENRTLPGLDVQVSWSSNSLTTSGRQAWADAPKGRNPDWSATLLLEVPLGGDVRATAQKRAQALRLEQSDLEVRAVRQALASDLYNRAAQLDAARTELQLWTQDLQARRGLLEAERLQYDNGSSTLARLLRRQTDLLEAQLRHGEAQTRVELARLALQLADGSLLDHHDVRIEED